MNFFFDNPFLAIILIAVISSFFKKKKEDPTNRQGRPKQQGKGQQRPLNPFEEARDLFKELARPVSEGTRPAPIKTMEKQGRRLKRSAESTEGSLVREERTSVNISNAVPETTQAAAAFAELMPNTTPEKKLEVKENHIIDAVIWSEILGPPRAKKTYKRNHFRS